MPKGKEKAWKRCVRKVKAKGKVDNAYAVCTASLTGKTKHRSKKKK